MAQTTMAHALPYGQGVESVGQPGGGSLLAPALLFSGALMMQGRVEEQQLASVIHQICWNPKAQRRLADNPDAFIAGLKVLPRVKVTLGIMKAALLAQKMTQPEFNWWWGVRDPDEDEGSRDRTGRPTPFATGVGRPGMN
jgi:hypothetical protein